MTPPLTFHVTRLHTSVSRCNANEIVEQYCTIETHAIFLLFFIQFLSNCIHIKRCKQITIYIELNKRKSNFKHHCLISINNLQCKHSHIQCQVAYTVTGPGYEKASVVRCAFEILLLKSTETVTATAANSSTLVASYLC